jgi:hypothetical protein
MDITVQRISAPPAAFMFRCKPRDFFPNGVGAAIAHFSATIAHLRGYIGREIELLPGKTHVEPVGTPSAYVWNGLLNKGAL